MEGFTESELLEKGLSLFSRGEYKKSEKLLSEVLEINKLNTKAIFCLANIFHIKGELGKSLKAFKKVLELEPFHTDAAVSLSVIYNDIGQYEDAKKVFEQANQRVRKKTTNQSIEDGHINKKFAVKHFELGDLYNTYQRYDEALFEYNKAISLDSSHLEIRIKVAKVYAKKGFHSKAFEELQRLQNENPSYLEARIALGVLYYGKGKILEAQNQWEKVLIKDPHNKEAGMYLNLSRTATETSLS